MEWLIKGDIHGDINFLKALKVDPDIEIVTESLLEAVLFFSFELFPPHPINVALIIVTNNVPTINFNFLLLIFIPPLS